MDEEKVKELAKSFYSRNIVSNMDEAMDMAKRVLGSDASGKSVETNEEDFHPTAKEQEDIDREVAIVQAEVDEAKHIKDEIKKYAKQAEREEKQIRKDQEQILEIEEELKEEEQELKDIKKDVDALEDVERITKQE